MDETRCLSLPEMLADAREFWQTARANGDVAGEAVWLDALNVLLDRM